jgi:hypothetical protein
LPAQLCQTWLQALGYWLMRRKNDLHINTNVRCIFSFKTQLLFFNRDEHLPQKATAHQGASGYLTARCIFVHSYQ